MSIRWAALVGHPVEHSFSPLIYRAFGYALDKHIHYRALDVRDRKLDAAFQIARDRQWIGWNVTLPHKVSVCKKVDTLDVSAQQAGAVNLVRFKDGHATGYNTDITGFLAPFKAHETKISKATVLILGAGGAARAVGAACVKENAGEIIFLNRTPEKAAGLASLFGGRACALEERALKKELARADIVINATSLGMDGTSTPIPQGVAFKKNTLAYDLVYRPRRTPFLKTAEAHGAKTIGGLEMLLAQAVEAWRIWFDEEIPSDIISRVRGQLEIKLDEDA